MNFLAHAYLSFGDTGILVGNMISDFVKGRSRFDYPDTVQKGIELHRAIDRFTDEHPITREAKQYFKSSVGLYAGAFVDVVYDHFLAADELHWPSQQLPEFAASVYERLGNYNGVLPDLFRQMLPRMSQQDWLSNYRYDWGIEKSFQGLVRRAAYLQDSVSAFEAFNEHYIRLQQLSQVFIPDVKKFAAGAFDRLIHG